MIPAEHDRNDPAEDLQRAAPMVAGVAPRGPGGAPWRSPPPAVRRGVPGPPRHRRPVPLSRIHRTAPATHRSGRGASDGADGSGRRYSTGVFSSRPHCSHAKTGSPVRPESRCLCPHAGHWSALAIRYPASASRAAWLTATNCSSAAAARPVSIAAARQLDARGESRGARPRRRAPPPR